MGKRKTTGRRDFLKMTAAGAAGMALSSGWGVKVFSKPLAAVGRSPLNKWPGRVAVNFNKAAADGSALGDCGDKVPDTRRIDQTAPAGQRMQD